MRKTLTAIIKKLDDDGVDDVINFLSNEHPKQAIPEVLKKLKAMKKSDNVKTKHDDKPEKDLMGNEKSWLTSEDDEPEVEPISDTEAH